MWTDTWVRLTSTKADIRSYDIHIQSLTQNDLIEQFTLGRLLLAKVEVRVFLSSTNLIQKLRNVMTPLSNRSVHLKHVVKENKKSLKQSWSCSRLMKWERSFTFHWTSELRSIVIRERRLMKKSLSSPLMLPINCWNEVIHCLFVLLHSFEIDWSSRNSKDSTSRCRRRGCETT